MRKLRVMAMVLTVIMLFALLSGCGGSKEANVQTVEPGTDGKITKEPLELTLYMRIFTSAYNFETSGIFQEALKKTNIKCRGVASETADGDQEYNIMLATSPLPDIVQGKAQKLNDGGLEGAYLPLDDLIDEYAPNIKKYFEEHPENYKGSLASDGKLYYIPYLLEKVSPSVGFYIRTDWLSKLDLEIPKTVDEFYNVLKAFRENDPNGNGEKDEIPYFFRDKSADGLLQLFGAKQHYYIDENGKVQNGRIQPEFKVAMQNLAKWYAEGLIDKEIYSRGKQAREVLFGNDLGGCTHDWFSSTGSFNHTMKEKVPGFELKVIPPPADINGVVKEEYGRIPITGLGWAISKDNKYVAETMKFFDFWYSEEGRMLYNFGVEGVHYNMVNGEPEYTDTVLKAPEGPPNFLRFQGQNEIGSVGLSEAGIKSMSPEAREGYEMYVKNGYCTDQFPVLPLTQEEDRVIKEKDAAIQTYMKEMTQKWLFGNMKIEDTWDEYLTNIENFGMNDVLAAYQSAYERYKSE